MREEGKGRLQQSGEEQIAERPRKTGGSELSLQEQSWWDRYY